MDVFLLFLFFFFMSKISPEAELNIIIGRAMGHTYDDLIQSTGHGNSTISRVLKPDNLISVVSKLFSDNCLLLQDLEFYKKWLHITLFVWWISIVFQIGLFFIF